MGLEDRGYRPDPRDRGALAVYLWRSMDRLWRLQRPYTLHMLLWGVPCGPTLSMLPGRGPLGILALTEQYAVQVRRPRLWDGGVA